MSLACMIVTFNNVIKMCNDMVNVLIKLREESTAGGQGMVFLKNSIPQSFFYALLRTIRDLWFILKLIFKRKIAEFCNFGCNELPCGKDFQPLFSICSPYLQSSHLPRLPHLRMCLLYSVPWFHYLGKVYFLGPNPVNQS